MKINSAEFHNYRCFGDFSIQLHSELNVFIGENGAGKTAAVKGLVTTLSMLNHTLGVTFNGPGNKDVKTTVQGGMETEGFLACRLNDNTDLRVDFKPNFEHKSETQNIGVYRNQPKEYQRLRDTITRNPAAEELVPVYAFYPAWRHLPDSQVVINKTNESTVRLAALNGASAAFTNYDYVVNWLYDAYVGELIAKDNGSVDSAVSHERDAINRAVQRVIPSVQSIGFTKTSPRKLLLRWQVSNGTVEDRLVSQLSDGYRAMLTLVIDFARRLVQANPQLEDPLSSEGVLFIDEIDLHLHPSWQQRIIGDLRKAFPNVQLIVTTHSPQVISSVQPENIYVFTDGCYERAIGKHTYGVESYRVLEELFGVSPEPEIEEISTLKEKYQSFISMGEGESTAAENLRKQLSHHLGANAPFMINTRAEIIRKRKQAG